VSATKPPVVDWTTDFDHTDPQWVSDPFPIWESLREGCPVAHSSRFGAGVWLPTTHELVSQIAYDTEHFTSREVIVFDGVPMGQAPYGGAPPITSDPPFHHEARRILLGGFSPKAINALEASTRELCRSLIGALADRDVVDAAKDYAQHIPVAVIARMMGFPESDADRFREWIHRVLESVDDPELAPGQDEQMNAFADLDAYVDGQIDSHRAIPVEDRPEDLTTHLLSCSMDYGQGDGVQPLAQEHIRGTLILLMIAGIDTTWSAIGASLLHLARHPDDRERLTNAVRVGDTDAVNTAMEELLRAYAPVTMARVVAKDVEVGGRLLREGEWVLLPFPSANRDPKAFDRADEVVLDRADNRHLAFGQGIHRCVGSNLARMELRVAIEEWLLAFDAFVVADEDGVSWSRGQVRGPRSLPMTVRG
jgi:cytochrome P450